MTTNRTFIVSAYYALLTMDIDFSKKLQNSDKNLSAIVYRDLSLINLYFLQVKNISEILKVFKISNH